MSDSPNIYSLTYYGIKRITISALEHTFGGESFYKPQLFITLDDGSLEDSNEEEKILCLICENISGEIPELVILQAATHAELMFGNVYTYCSVIDLQGEIVQETSLKDLEEKFQHTINQTMSQEQFDQEFPEIIPTQKSITYH